MSLSVVLLLAGCGSADETTDVKHKAATRKPVVEQSPDVDLVAAVLTPGGTAPAGLRFEIPQRPVPNQPFSLRIQVSPAQDVTQLQLRVDPSAGLELADASPLVQLGKAAAGETRDHTLGLTAGKEGVFELRATVVTETDKGEAGSSSFSIPVIVTAEAVTPPGPK